MRVYVHMHKSTCGMQVEEAHFYIYKTTSQHTQKNWGHGNSLSQTEMFACIQQHTKKRLLQSATELNGHVQTVKHILVLVTIYV